MVLSTAERLKQLLMESVPFITFDEFKELVYSTHKRHLRSVSVRDDGEETLEGFCRIILVEIDLYQFTASIVPDLASFFEMEVEYDKVSGSYGRVVDLRQCLIY